VRSNCFGGTGYNIRVEKRIDGNLVKIKERLIIVPSTGTDYRVW